MGRKTANLEALQAKIGYQFGDQSLLKLALTHRSLAGGPQENNERLEFLGDAVLQLTVSKYLYEKYPRLPEGELAKKRSLLVRESAVASVAKELELNKYLMVGRESCRPKRRSGILCFVTRWRRSTERSLRRRF